MGAAPRPSASLAQCRTTHLALLLPLWMIAACSPAREDVLSTWQVAGGDAVAGRRLMAHYQCGSCHVIPDVAANGSHRGPPLARFGRRSYIAGQLPNTPEGLQRWLLDPPAELPGTPMPRLGLSEQDARDIAAALMAQR
ncbi:c-type cytochrome [Roseateles amylovorans]|uniref:C-type cytochrome n=1 Tax=Roseateles amylovorans TaxID=2978473 RepID=A0ABY6B8N2_9BURK|nr:c-type cytochrome [Roseateles amylovorans]UXH80738.1 c-type cytochrome [Roseateles amylovorans]